MFDWRHKVIVCLLMIAFHHFEYVVASLLEIIKIIFDEEECLFNKPKHFLFLRWILLFLNKMTLMDNGCLQQLRLLFLFFTLIMFEIKAIFVYLVLLIRSLLSRMRHLLNCSKRSHLVFVVLESTEVMCLWCMNHFIIYFIVFHCIDNNGISPLVLIFYFLNEFHLSSFFLLDCCSSFLNSRRLLWFSWRFSYMHASIDISRLR